MGVLIVGLEDRRDEFDEGFVHPPRRALEMLKPANMTYEQVHIRHVQDTALLNLTSIGCCGKDDIWIGLHLLHR